MGIKIAVISGSVRPGNYTSKAVALVLDEFKSHQDVHVDLVDPQTLHLVFPGQTGGEADQKKIVSIVSGATGIVLATPEYHGTYSSAIKLVIENLGFPSVLSGKPVALLGVAAGQIGAIKALEHLRSVCSHVGSIVLPGPVSVAGVQQVFNAQGECLDKAIEKRIRRVGINLLDYIQKNLCPRIALEELVRQKEKALS